MKRVILAVMFILGSAGTALYAQTTSMSPYDFNLLPDGRITHGYIAPYDDYLMTFRKLPIMKWVKNNPSCPDLYVSMEREQTVMGAWNEMIHFRDPLRNNQYIDVRVSWTYENPEVLGPDAWRATGLKQLLQVRSCVKADATGAGFCMPELAAVVPEAIYTDSAGNRFTQPSALITLLVDAVSKLNGQLETQEDQLQQLGDGAITATDRQAMLSVPRLASAKSRCKLCLETATDANRFVLITDMQGNILKQLDGKDFVNGSYTLESGGLQQGMYLCSLFEDGQLVQTRRMILND